jgi:hypothetical protein
MRMGMGIDSCSFWSKGNLPVPASELHLFIKRHQCWKQLLVGPSSHVYIQL